MKTLILAITLLISFGLQAQQTLNADQLLAKSARQRKSGWLYVSAGTTITSLGASFFAVAAEGTSREKGRNTAVAGVLTAFGVGNIIAGISNLSASRRNRLAAAELQLEIKDAQVVQVGSITYPAISLKIRL